MAVVRTDLRDTRQRAKEVAYYPTSTLTGRNVQDAIDQVQVEVVSNSGKPPAIVPTLINFANSPYAVQPADYLILVDTSAGAVVINMMAAANRNNLPVEIKDSTGTAAANSISVVRSGADTIDGLTTYPMASAYVAFTFKPAAGGYKVI